MSGTDGEVVTDTGVVRSVRTGCLMTWINDLFNCFTYFICCPSLLTF